MPGYDREARLSRSARHHHVFFDPTGRRWMRLKLLVLFLTVVVAAVGSLAWERVHEPPTDAAAPGVPANAMVTDAPDEPPEIGTGPLVRVVDVTTGPDGHRVAVDPLTDQVVRPLTPGEIEEVGDSGVAVDRYGYSSAAHKTISLTFDDGPDPTWTPKILDLLHRHGVQATFFVTGSEVIRHPEIVERIVDEGHAIGNHTFTHPLVTSDTIEQEVVPTDRVIRAVTGVETPLFRMPYEAYDAKGRMREESLNAMLAAQRMGYLVSAGDFDTKDWSYGDPDDAPAEAIALPPATEDNMTMLLHDGGGNRAPTVDYVEKLIPWAQQNGYAFHSLPQVSEQVGDATETTSPTIWDRTLFLGYRAKTVLPGALLHSLFLLAVATVVVGGLLNVALAVARRIRSGRRFAGLPKDAGGPPVSVVIAAFDEEAVIAKTLASVARSRYPDIVELLVVDDGSRDGTAAVVAEIAAGDPRIRLLRQRNRGKAAALTHGFRMARGDVVVTLDADTVFTPDTVGNLVRHFTFDTGGRLAAVCGVIKVGNLRSLLSRWQALEYVTQLGVERGAQDLLHGIMVVPGACAAWRRDVVLHAGGYSPATLTEDCDMALTLQKAGYRVVQDDEAEGYTEAPEGPRALAKQRFRWLYGNLQALWKHRGMILNPRFGWLGMVTMPLAVMSVVVPVVFLPFVYLMAAITIQGQGLRLIVVYAALFLGVQLASALVGTWLTRERPVHLLMVPLYRVIYEPLRAFLLYKATFAVLVGRQHSWNKLRRTGTVPLRSYEPDVELAS